jgi:RNA polymerase sigma-70 factor (ECF subfamily)
MERFGGELRCYGLVLGLRMLVQPAIGSTEDVCYGPEPLTRSRPASSSLRAEALAHADALFRLAFHLTGNQADAEDLVQDTYARAFGAAARFEEGSNLRAWLFRILRNVHIDQYRRARNSPVGGNFDDEDESVAAPSQELLRDDQELERLRSVVAEDIEAALLTLSPDARTTVLLDLEGLTESELASVLGCAVGTVKSRLMRARQALRLRLKDYAR